MKIFIVVPLELIKGGLVKALCEELASEPKNRMVIAYPSSIPTMHKTASDLAGVLGINQVSVEGRLNNHLDFGAIAEMLKEYERSKQVNTLIIMSPDTNVVECILRLTSGVAEPANQWLWEAQLLSQQHAPA